MTDSTEAFCDLDELLERDGREDAVAKNLGTTTVQGERAVRIEQTEGSQREVLTIRVAEPHYVLRIEESEVDHFRFSDIDEEATIQAPTPTWCSTSTSCSPACRAAESVPRHPRAVRRSPS
ncbi:hypothetical protein [Nocardioides kongjuensis]|uniref:hypothetical protein n=1 Tax=Nocardioides kongjuensis TaxID=349522 RepID=UPI0031EDDD19